MYRTCSLLSTCARSRLLHQHHVLAHTSSTVRPVRIDSSAASTIRKLSTASERCPLRSTFCVIASSNRSACRLQSSSCSGVSSISISASSTPCEQEEYTRANRQSEQHRTDPRRTLGNDPKRSSHQTIRVNSQRLSQAMARDVRGVVDARNDRDRAFWSNHVLHKKRSLAHHWPPPALIPAHGSIFERDLQLAVCKINTSNQKQSDTGRRTP